MSKIESDGFFDYLYSSKSNLVGPTGPTGATGPTGPIGNTGATGSIPNIQTGVDPQNPALAAAQSTAPIAVTFPVPFSSPPKVIASSNSSGGTPVGFIVSSIINITNTGFTYRYTNTNTTTPLTATAINLDWIAIL